MMLTRLYLVVFCAGIEVIQAHSINKEQNRVYNDSTKMTYKEISFEEAKLLITNKKGVLNPTYTKPNLSQVYSLNDGKILVIGKKACFLYNSEDDIKELLKTGRRSFHILYDLNYYGSELPLKEDDSKVKIADLFNIDIKSLDFSERSLDIIDQRIIYKTSSGELTKRQLKENIIYLIVYTGAVFNKKYGGSWMMILDSDQKTWQPYNIMPNSERIDLFTWVFSALIDTEEGEIPSIGSGYHTRVNMFLSKK